MPATHAPRIVFKRPAKRDVRCPVFVVILACSHIFLSKTRRLSSATFSDGDVEPEQERLRRDDAHTVRATVDALKYSLPRLLRPWKIEDKGRTIDRIHRSFQKAKNIPAAGPQQCCKHGGRCMSTSTPCAPSLKATYNRDWHRDVRFSAISKRANDRGADETHTRILDPLASRLLALPLEASSEALGSRRSVTRNAKLNGRVGGFSIRRLRLWLPTYPRGPAAQIVLNGVAFQAH